MKNQSNKKLLLPKSPLGIASVVFFCGIWWLLNNKPFMQIFDKMAKEGNIIWVLGMPVNFFYIIAVAAVTVIWSFVVFAKWEVGDSDE